jgi:biopolymer transport protein ExbD
MNPRARKQKTIAEINITPFTDVILVLLVIFMITTPLMLQSSIKVNIPSAGSAKAADSSRQIRITVTDKGLIYLDDISVSKKKLKEKVAAMWKDDPDLKVILFSDKSARFSDIVAVLDTMKELGVHNLNIAAKTGSNDK